MADNYSVFNPTVDLNPYTNQIAELQRRQRMAQLLQQQGMEPIESQVVGGRVIRTSPWQVLAKALQTGMGAYQESQANKAAADLREQMAYDQRQKEAEVASAGQQIMGRMYGEKPPQYDKNGLLVTPRETEPAVTEPSQPSDQLGEITPTAKYQYDPSAALRQAMTPAGTEAMKANPLLASLLAQMAKPKTLEIGAIDPSKFTPESIRAAQSSGDYAKLEPITTTPKLELQRKTRTIYDKSGNEMYQDYNFNPATGVEQLVGTPYRGKPSQTQEFNPDTIKMLVARLRGGDKTALYGLGRSAGAVMAVQNELARQLQEEGVNPTEIAAAQRKLTIQNNIEKDFTTGKAGQNLKSINTFVQHANHLYDLADALDRGDVALFNRIGALWQQETNSPVPNNLDEVGQLVADELQKAALGAAGGQEERQALKNKLSGTGKSGKVIKEAIEQARGLVKGQLSSLKQQWTAGYGDKDEFDNRFLTDESRSLFNKPQQATTLPAEAASKLSEGKVTKFANGQSWTLRNGQPVKVSP